MRRLPEDERPLPLCLSWSSEGLDAKRFVLQENDTGEIIVSSNEIHTFQQFKRSNLSN